MLLVPYEYSGKKFLLEPYSTKQEKDFLLMGSLGAIGDTGLYNALKVLNLSDELINSLSTEEQVAMLFKYRSISVGEEIPIKLKCPSCNTVSDVSISIEDLIIEPTKSNENIIDKFKEVTDENFNEFIKTDISEMDLDEYYKLFEEAKDCVTKFNFRKPCTCMKCKSTNFINLFKDTSDVSIDNVINYMSEDSLNSIYQAYNDLNFFGKYSKIDIDSMLPFERTIFIGLLNKTREELKNG